MSIKNSETYYKFKNKVVAKMEADGSLVVINPSILLENHYGVLTTKEDEDDHGIILVKQLHKYLSEQSMSRKKQADPTNILREDVVSNELD